MYFVSSVVLVSGSSSRRLPFLFFYHSWHLYDYYLNPGGAYFGTKKACEPLHAMFSYANSSVWLVNSLYTSADDIAVDIAIYNYTSSLVYHQRVDSLHVDGDGIAFVASLPSHLPATTKTYFLILSLFNASQVVVSSNTYWLSTHTDKIDWKKSTWYNSPLSQYADFHDLTKLPQVSPNITIISYSSESITVNIQNPSSDSILFFVRLRLLVGAEDVLPVLWSDNYLTLLPLAEMEVTAQYEVLNTQPMVIAECWNNIPH